MTLSLCSCDFRSLFGGEQTSSDNVKDDPIVGDGSSYSEFINVMKEIKTRGDKTSEMGLPVNSEYYYSFAGASVSAFRYAVEYILWLKGEGDTLRRSNPMRGRRSCRRSRKKGWIFTI